MDLGVSALVAHRVHEPRGLEDEEPELLSLADVARDRPGWAGRLDRLLGACRRLGSSIPEPAPRGIHRDFYPDQVLVDGRRLYCFR